MKKIVSAFLICLITLAGCDFALAKKKEKIPKMPETKAEWLEKSECVPIEKRKIKEKNINENKKLTKVSPPNGYFVKYNSPPNSYRVNISEIKKKGTMYSGKIVAPDFEKAGIVYYYYNNSHNQISSELFIIPLEKTKTRYQRVIDAGVIDLYKGKNLTSGVYEFKENYFKTLNVIDFSSNSKNILVEEKIGTEKSGVFKTIMISGSENDEGIFEYKRYPELNEKIIEFNKEQNNILLNNYRWDIKTLGFALDEKDLAVVKAVVWDNRKKEKFLNLWGINIKTGEIKLISTRNDSIPLEENALILEFTYE